MSLVSVNLDVCCGVVVKFWSLEGEVVGSNPTVEIKGVTKPEERGLT